VAPSSNQIEGSEIEMSQSVVPLGNDAVTTTGSKRSSPAGDESVPPSKRIRTESNSSLEPKFTVNNSASVEPVEPSTNERKPKAVVLPARRSTRQATVQSTQISEGTLRPPGPPCLEAALSIALRNLESETWRYLWTYYKNHRGDPLPTTAHVKQACPQVRTAAEVVDRADRELEDAIDELMRSASKTKRRVRLPSGRQPEKISKVDHPQVEYVPADIGDRDDGGSSSLLEQEDESDIEPADECVSAPQGGLEASSKASSRSTKSAGPLGVQQNSPRAHRFNLRGRRK